MALWRTCNQSCGLELRQEFFQGLCGALERDRFTGVPLVGFEMDVIQGPADEFVRGFGRCRQGFRPTALRQEGIQFFPGRPKVAKLFQDVPGPAQHRDGTILVFQQMFEIEHHIGDHVVQRVIETLLDGPSGQASNHTGCFRHLALQQQHDVIREQVLRRLRGMVNDALDHMEGTLNRAVQQGDGIALFTGLFKPFKDRPKRAHR